MNPWPLAALAAGVLAVYLLGYWDGREYMVDRYSQLVAQVEIQNETAQQKLDQLTVERDARQAELDQQAELQEKKDAEAKSEIARLDDELRNRPVRVRIVTEAGVCGSSPADNPATATGDSDGSGAEAYGLLPESNTRRLAGALTEVETLSAAYNSCRARLLP